MHDDLEGLQAIALAMRPNTIGLAAIALAMQPDSQWIGGDRINPVE
jgi:hypothetical protein